MTGAALPASRYRLANDLASRGTHSRHLRRLGDRRGGRALLTAAPTPSIVKGGPRNSNISHWESRRRFWLRRELGPPAARFAFVSRRSFSTAAGGHNRLSH